MPVSSMARGGKLGEEKASRPPLFTFTVRLPRSNESSMKMQTYTAKTLVAAGNRNSRVGGLSQSSAMYAQPATRVKPPVAKAQKCESSNTARNRTSASSKTHGTFPSGNTLTPNYTHTHERTHAHTSGISSVAAITSDTIKLRCASLNRSLRGSMEPVMMTVLDRFSSTKDSAEAA